MPTQTTLFETAGASSVAWREAALSALEGTCRARPEFTVDDVRERLDEVLEIVGIAQHYELRAMASVLSEGRKQGWCEKTGRFVRTKQAKSHCGPRMVWRSLMI